MGLLSMKLVEHIPGKSRVYKNALGFSKTIIRQEHTLLVGKASSDRFFGTLQHYTGVGTPPGYRRVKTGKSHIEVITNWGKTFLNSFAHGIHAPKIK